MKLISRTPKKAVLEIKNSLLSKHGFDFIWDDIRDSYPLEKYDLFKINNEEDSIFIELSLKK